MEIQFIWVQVIQAETFGLQEINSNLICFKIFSMEIKVDQRKTVFLITH